MQKYIAAGCIKGFLIISKPKKPKTRKNKLVKTLTSLGLYILKKKLQKWGLMGITFVCK